MPGASRTVTTVLPRADNGTENTAWHGPLFRSPMRGANRSPGRARFGPYGSSVMPPSERSCGVRRLPFVSITTAPRPSSPNTRTRARRASRSRGKVRLISFSVFLYNSASSTTSRQRNSAPFARGTTGRCMDATRCFPVRTSAAKNRLMSALRPNFSPHGSVAPRSQCQQSAAPSRLEPRASRPVGWALQPAEPRHWSYRCPQVS